MSASYESIFLVDLEHHDIQVCRKNLNLDSNFWSYVDTNPEYDELLKRYIEYRVASEDRSRMLEIAGLKNLKQILKKRASYSFDYRIKNTGQTVWYRMRFTNLSTGEELTRFTVSFENISEEKKTELLSYIPGKKILVIEDNEIDRDILKNILDGDYDVLLASNGQEGLDILEKNYESIDIIITDLEMPVCSGYEFLKIVSETRRYSSIPVIITTVYDNTDSEVEALEMGAADFMRKPYNAEIVKHRVKGLIRLRTSLAMLNTLQIDPVTGLYTRDFFFKKAQEIIDENPDDEFRFVVTDVIKFKLINEKYGIDTGDKVLEHIGTAGRKFIPNYIIGGRLGGDKFVWMQTKHFQERDYGRNVAHEILAGAPVPNLILKHGIYYMTSDSRDISVQTMCDRAIIAVESIKGIYGQYCAVYDDSIRKELVLRQQITSDMEESLKDGEFKIYLQPKHNLTADSTGGAEALVRWIHPDLGFMNPGVFIPLFEQNGFIKELDEYVIHQVCKTIKTWQEDGKMIIPISVNLSRRDFEIPDLDKIITDIVDSYDLEHKYIHIELTESAFVDNPDTIKTVIKSLHDNGFVIELDDFGKGYSSLTTLTSLEIDTLKLDMSIIKEDIPGSKNNVLDFCMQLVNMMHLTSVAEGVETIEQVDRLKSLGCDYIQGFYYSKPLSVDDFEKYLNKND